MIAMVHSFGSDTDFFNIVAGVLQGDTFSPLLFIICQDYILQMSIENGFTLKKSTRSRQYTAETIMDADYTDDLVLYSYIHIQIYIRNIIKHNIQTLISKQIHFFIKIYLSHFILERVDVGFV